MFLDNASTTKVDAEIIKDFEKLNDEYFYNPGGLYSEGRKVKTLIEGIRQNIISLIGGEEQDKLIFTGSASEANNLAIMGCVKKNTKKILVSMGEHPSVYNTALELKNRGYDVQFIDLNRDGVVDISDFENKMTKDVEFVSVMHVSNETGAINDIKKLVNIAKSVNPNVIFHTDGVQAVGKIAVDVYDLGVDMYTMSAHKIHGMKGVGALYVKNGVNLKPIIFGGGQESGLRSGTENLLGIYSLGKAIEKAVKSLDENFKYVKGLKQYILDKLTTSHLEYSVHSLLDGSPYILSLSFLGCRAETVLNLLSDKGIYIGNGSACSSKKMGNRILNAMGVPNAEIEGNLRISFSKYNTEREIEGFVETLFSVVSEYIDKVR